MSFGSSVLRVGIIGCGEVAQVVHIPNVNFLSHKFRTTYLCDISNNALEHCSKMVQGGLPKTTKKAEELCSSDEVDVVLICNSDEYHVAHGILALKHNKWCLIEKPLALCFRDIDHLIAAEKVSKGKVFVGTMRRFAPAFIEAVEEVGGMEKILYARIRAIIGPNSNFVGQSGTYPKNFTDFKPADVEDKAARETDIVRCALGDEFGVAVTEDSIRMLRMLGSLNTHDLSAMREIIGMPKSVLGACLGLPGIYSALFQYDGFAVTFESGINSVPVFDVHIEVYAEDKIIRVDFDSPYVKGLPVTMTVREMVSSRPGADTFGYQERIVRRTYEDPYTLEMLDFYECVVNGKSVKTSAEDAKKELELYKMILRAGEHSYKTVLGN